MGLYTQEHYKINRQISERAEGCEANFLYKINKGGSKGMKEGCLLWLTEYGKAFSCVYHARIWNILRMMGMIDPEDIFNEWSYYKTGKPIISRKEW